LVPGRRSAAQPFRQGTGWHQIRHGLADMVVVGMDLMRYRSNTDKAFRTSHKALVAGDDGVPVQGASLAEDEWGGSESDDPDRGRSAHGIGHIRPATLQARRIGLNVRPEDRSNRTQDKCCTAKPRRI
jgi:hypothetical protein